MINIIIPAIKFMIFLFFVKKFIIIWLLAADIIENNNKGNAIPIPKTIKFKRLVTKPKVDVLIANNTTNDAGLHGKTITPKKKPKIKDE